MRIYDIGFMFVRKDRRKTISLILLSKLMFAASLCRCSESGGVIRESYCLTMLSACIYVVVCHIDWAMKFSNDDR